MSWTVRIGDRALARLMAWDPALRIELAERVAEIADRPLDYLTRAPVGEFAGMRVLAYRSDVIDTLTATVYIDGMDDDPQRPVVVWVRGAMEPESE